MRPTAASMSASSSRPLATASCAPSKKPGVVITMSLPALTRGRRRVGVVGADVLLPHHAADVVPVGDQRAGVAPLAAQHVVEQPVVDGDRHAVHRLVAEHERAAALPGDPLERRQEPRAQLAPGDVGLAGVAAALRLGVAGEVLGAGQDRRRVVQAVALVAAHHRRGELADEERVLAERLADPAPAQVAGDAQHRGERPVDAGRGDLDGGARATRSTRSASQVAAMPSCVGKIVAPSQNEWPWMQSSATSSGIRSRVRAVSVVRLAAPAPARRAGSSPRAS